MRDPQNTAVQTASLGTAPDQYTVVDRIAKLERQNRSFQQMIAFLGLIAAPVLLGAARPHRTVEAERFLLRGPGGAILATLEPTRQGCQLSLQDDLGRTQARLMTRDIGPILTLYSTRTGREAASFAVNKGVPFFHMLDDRAPERSMTLSVAREKSGLVLSDAGGRHRLVLLEKPTGLELTADGKALSGRP